LILLVILLIKRAARGDCTPIHLPTAAYEVPSVEVPMVSTVGGLRGSIEAAAAIIIKLDTRTRTLPSSARLTGTTV